MSMSVDRKRVERMMERVHAAGIQSHAEVFSLIGRIDQATRPNRVNEVCAVSTIILTEMLAITIANSTRSEEDYRKALAMVKEDLDNLEYARLKV